MIQIKTLREYAETLLQRVDEIGSVTMVCIDKEMSDALRQMKQPQFPALFVVVPMAEEHSDGPDNIMETSQCLLFLLDRTDNQRRNALQVLEETQAVVERLKRTLREDAAHPCHFMSGMKNLNTNPESGLYADYSGWSLSFNLED